MFTSVVKAVALLTLAARGISAALQPIVLQPLAQSGLSQCATLTVAWSGGAPPYDVFLLSNKTGPVIKAFPLQNGTSFSWEVNLAAGTNFVVQVLSSPDTDHSVPTATSDGYTIAASSDSSCINTSIVGAPYGATAPVPTTSATTKGPFSNPSLTTVPASLATSSSPQASSSIKTNKTVPVVVGILGGVIALAAITFCIMFCFRRKNQAKMAKKRKSFVGKPRWVDAEDLEIRKPVPTHF